MSSPTLELKNEIVRAGAGAGKTTGLTKRVLEVVELYLKHNQSEPRIIVTTFTKKATEELRERLVQEVFITDKLHLLDFVTSKSRLHISTIHGVLSLFLKRYGHLAGFDAGFKVVDQNQTERSGIRILRELLVEHKSYPLLLEHFSFYEIFKMANLFIEALSVNKNITTVTQAEITEFILDRRCQEAHELSRLAKIAKGTTESESWSNYLQHLIDCAQLLQFENTLSGQEILDRIQSETKPRFLSKKPAFSAELHESIKDCLDRIEELGKESYNLKYAELYSSMGELFLDLAKSYNAKMTEVKYDLGQIEISDLENLSLDIIRKHPEIANLFSSQWDYWLIDEFQDTSPIQVELLEKLIGKSPYYVVGDPQQSIYLFRGARSEVFNEKEADILRAGGQLSQLSKNYRSRPELLYFFNDFFSQFDQPFMEMSPKAEDYDNKNIVAKFKIVSDETDLYLPIANEIEQGIKNGCRFDDFCILARTNSDLTEIALYLEQQGIPTHVHASSGFYRRREILDLLSFLKFLLNPLDNLNLIRLVRSPWLNISDQDITNIFQTRPIFYWNVMLQKIPQNASVIKLANYLSLKDQVGLYETMRLFALESGFLNASSFHDSTGRRESNIWKFLALMQESEKRPGFSYMNFVHRAFTKFGTAEGEEESDAVAALEPNRVNLMTIHKSKGLKFKYVILPNAHKKLKTSDQRAHELPLMTSEDGSHFTLALRLGDERKIMHNPFGEKWLKDFGEKEKNEHLRLLYVALTRAELGVSIMSKESWLKDSWMAKIKMNLETGTHVCDKYSYSVEREFVATNLESQMLKRASGVRKAWCQESLPAAVPIKFSVSSLIESVISEKSDVTSAIKGEEKLWQHIERPVFGEKLHEFFEKFKYTKSDDVSEYADMWFRDDRDVFSRAVSYTLNLSTPPVRDLIRNGEVEWGFQLATGRGILEGQIDLWGVEKKNGKNKVWIVDYKSGSSRYSDKAFEQLKLYALILKAMKIEGEFQLAVLYARDEIVEIQDFTDADAVQIRLKYNL